MTYSFIAYKQLKQAGLFLHRDMMSGLLKGTTGFWERFESTIITNTVRQPGLTQFMGSREINTVQLHRPEGCQCEGREKRLTPVEYLHYRNAFFANSNNSLAFIFAYLRKKSTITELITLHRILWYFRISKNVSHKSSRS